MYLAALGLSCIVRGLSLRFLSSLVGTGGLWSAQASVVDVHRLSCSVACRILVYRPGIEPTSPTLQADSLPLSHQGNPDIKIGT